VGRIAVTAREAAMRTREMFRTGLEWCGTLLCVVVALPIVALVLFVLRFAVLGVAALGMAALLVGLCASGRLRCRAKEILGPMSDEMGPTAKPM
jgi:hypothetical protein